MKMKELKIMAKKKVLGKKRKRGRPTGRRTQKRPRIKVRKNKRRD